MFVIYYLEVLFMVRSPVVDRKKALVWSLSNIISVPFLMLPCCSVTYSTGGVRMRSDLHGPYERSLAQIHGQVLGSQLPMVLSGTLDQPLLNAYL